MAACCNGYTRARLVRHAVARAGDGLPPIERGMPAPAGTGLSRRHFLWSAGGLALSVYGASKLGLSAFDEGIAEAAGVPSAPILVSIFMPGGADSLSLLPPIGDPRYPALRPTLKVTNPGPALVEDPRLHWHPAAAGLTTLYGEGKVAVVPAVGYDNADGSHFTSRHYWEVGATDPSLQLGWLGRYLDRAGTPDNPLQGLALNGDLSPALAPASVPVSALDSPAAYVFSAPGVSGGVADTMVGGLGALAGVATDPAELGLATARAVSGAAGRLRGQLAGFVAPDGSTQVTSPVPYPQTDLGSRLAAVAAMAAAGLPLRVVTVEDDDGDYDTHSDQLANFGPRLQGVGDSVLAFQRDLEARGIADRVVTLLWSEFGRRPQENGSGTDHGAAGSAYLIGARVRGGMVGEFPGLAQLDDNDNLRMTSDFRSVYCSLLEQWLGHDAAEVIPGAAGFARPVLIR